MKTIGCTFTMSGIYYLEEKSVCAARLKALKALPLPENRDYLDDSLVVDDLAECMLMNDWSDAEVDALSKFSPEELIDELDSRRKGYVGIKFIDAEFTPARLKEFLLDYYGVDYDEIKTVRTDESFVEENQERCVSDTDSEGIRKISIEERTAADFKGKIFCPYSHDGHSARVEMELRHCHTTADRDAWYECPVCGACSPTASAGTFDENSVEAYRLACRTKDSF